MKQIILNLEQDLNKECTNLTSTNSNEQTIILDSVENVNEQKALFYSSVSTNCQNIKDKIEKIKELNQEINRLKETTNLKNNVIKCIELLSILKENKNYDFNYFKNNKEFREIFYYFKDSKDIKLTNIFDEYLKVCKL
ncbi:MAG: hypothetical protein ACN23H_00190 [Candidatus Phytoplasma vitis]|nr:MAG: hypothetical protein M6G77_02465 [Candidatus Phytoplasma vitis]